MDGALAPRDDAGATGAQWLVRLKVRGWLGYVLGIGAVGLGSLVIGQVTGQTQAANIAMLYLVVILATATLAGRGPAILASVAAFVAFNWFFVEPRYTLTVADPEEWIALVIFLVTAVVTGQLAASLRKRAAEAESRRHEAEQREREASVLYDVVRLLAEPDLAHACAAVAERIRRELGLAAVGIRIPASGEERLAAVAGDDRDGLLLLTAQADTPTQLLGSGSLPAHERRGSPGRWVQVIRTIKPRSSPDVRRERLLVVPVNVHGVREGDVLLVRHANAAPFHEADNRLLSAVATQIGAALDRQRLRQDATEAEVLRRTDDLKSALLAAVSHDLRTPLASILAAAGSLRQRDVPWTDDERDEFAHDIETEARRLNRLVENLLDLSRMEAGTLRPQKAWHDLGTLVEDVLRRLTTVVSQHPVRVEVPDDLPPVLLDAVEIDQVLSNLVENAAKHTPRGTEIAVRARAGDNGAVEIAVEDRGPGLPQAALERVFERFYRGAGVEPRVTGTGLGLAVARALVEAHGGSIRAESRPDGGARFVFTLPGGTPAPLADLRVPA